MNNICVVHIIDDYQLALNIGKDQGVKLDQRYQIYALSEHEIIDPLTSDSLGYLEIVKGTGKVTSVQSHMCIIESDMRTPSRKKIVRKPAFGYQQLEEYFDSDDCPFDDPEIGDYAKLID